MNSLIINLLSKFIYIKYIYSIGGICFLHTGHSDFLSLHSLRHSGWNMCLQGVTIKCCTCFLDFKQNKSLFFDVTFINVSFDIFCKFEKSLLERLSCTPKPTNSLFCM